MSEILFVIGFFMMLLLIGISLPGILVALVVATLVMFIGGLLAVVFNMLPWLVLAVVGVWLYRTHIKPCPDDRRRLFR